MQRLIISLLLVVLMIGGAYAFYERQQSNIEIDKSLKDLGTALTEAEKDHAQYEGGLIKVLIELRIQTIKATVAMLEQKRRSLLHRIMLTYNVEGSPLRPAGQEQLDAIQADMRATFDRIMEATTENDRYSGGLVKALLEMRLYTEKQTLASLQQRYLLAKYGISHMALPNQEGGTPPAKPRPTVPDKEGL